MRIQLQFPKTPPGPVPQRVEGSLLGKKVINVACGSFHTAALTASGEVYCWGDNANGQCGARARPRGGGGFDSCLGFQRWALKSPPPFANL